MPTAGTVRVTGYREFLRACDRAGRETKRFVRETYREVGDIVKEDAAEKFIKYSERSAAGFRTRVRQRGVNVEQSLRKTTGKRPDWGALQMREALVPALDEKAGQVEQAFDHAIDKVADHFDR